MMSKYLFNSTLFFVYSSLDTLKLLFFSILLVNSFIFFTISLQISSSRKEQSNLLQDISFTELLGEEQFHPENNLDESEGSDSEESDLYDDYNLYEDYDESIGGAKNYKLTIDFEKIEGTYKKTKEYIENLQSTKYENYIEKLQKYYSEQKQKKNREKFNYRVDEKGQLIKECKDTEKCKDNYVIKHPNYENIQSITYYLTNKLINKSTKGNIHKTKVFVLRGGFRRIKSPYLSVKNL